MSGAGASDGAKADTAGVDAVAADVGKLVVDGGGEEDDSGDEKKKKSKRGGGVIRGGPKKKAAPVGGAVIITKKDRGRRCVLLGSHLLLYFTEAPRDVSAVGRSTRIRWMSIFLLR